ncbi:MAG TPA: hypothetical protein VGR28_07610 [Candidatus Thermoplasmatota archaeon]|nr:hypothetical protein [Candidatus Thermoplasmatota archaeon]
MLASAYRACWQLRRGPPRALRDVVAQEGHAARFAGIEHAQPGNELARAEASLALHLEDRQFSTWVAAMYGDEAARALGFAALGVPAMGGFALALAQAARGPAPETLLAPGA